MRNWAGWLLIATVAGCGGVEVSGIVRDRETGEPLPGAIVGIGDEVTRTDGGGNYELEVELDDDDRPVRAFANAPGYQSSTEFMGSHDDRDELYRDFELTKSEARRQQEQQKQQEMQELRRQEQRWQQQQQQRSATQDPQGQPAAEITTDEAGAIIIVPKAKQEEPQLYEGTIELRPSEEQQQQGRQGQEQQQQEQQQLDEQDLQDDEDDGAFESR